MKMQKISERVDISFHQIWMSLDWYVLKFSVNLEICEENIDRLLLLIADNQDKSYLTPYLTACNVLKPMGDWDLFDIDSLSGRQILCFHLEIYDGLEQDSSISITNALKILQSCNKPSNYGLWKTVYSRFIKVQNTVRCCQFFSKIFMKDAP